MNWSPEETERLRELWRKKDSDISGNVALFPGRSLDALYAKAHRMALKLRTHERTRAELTWAHIQTILAFHGPYAAWQVAGKLGLSESSVRRYIHAHRAELHSPKWVRSKGGLHLVRSYSVGPGENVDRPLKEERKVKYDMRVRRNIREGRQDVFATLIKQVI